MSLDSMLGRSLAIAASVALLSLTACDEKFAGRGLSGLVPRGAPACSEAAMQSLMESARDLGSAFGVGVAWDENGVGNIPDQVHIVGMFGVPDVVVLGAFDDVLDDPTLRAPLESMLVEMLLERPVAFLGLGNEIDMHDRFEERAALIEDLIQLVHSVGTDTVVFTVFQYEHLRTQPDPKAMVDAVPSADLVAFTVYPWLAYPDVAAMPEDYFGPILEWTTKPVAFTEPTTVIGSSAITGQIRREAVPGPSTADCPAMAWSSLAGISLPPVPEGKRLRTRS